MAIAVVNTGAEAHSTVSTASITTSATIGSGANLLVVFTNNVGTVTCTGVTYNSIPLTSLGVSSSNFFGNINRVEMWYLINPPIGTPYNLIAAFSAAQQDMGFTWQSFSGYDHFGTFYANNSPLNAVSANGNVTVSDWASGDYTVGSILDTVELVTSNDTEMGHYISASNNDNHVSTAYTTTDGILNWTHGSTPWAACAVAIKGPSTTIISGTISFVSSSLTDIFGGAVLPSSTTISGASILSFDGDYNVIISSTFASDGTSAIVWNGQSISNAVLSSNGTSVVLFNTTALTLESLLARIIQLEADMAAVPTAEQNATAVWTKIIEGLTAEEMMRVLLAASAGKRQGLGTATETYMARDGITPRITITPDSSGNGVPIINGTV